MYISQYIYIVYCNPLNVFFDITVTQSIYMCMYIKYQWTTYRRESERERERERARKRESGKPRASGRAREWVRERARVSEREGGRERESERERERWWERVRERERDTHTHTHTHTQKCLFNRTVNKSVYQEMNDLFVAIRCCKTINTSNCWKENAPSRNGLGARPGELAVCPQGGQGEQLNWNRPVSSSESEGPHVSAVRAEVVEG